MPLVSPYRSRIEQAVIELLHTEPDGRMSGAQLMPLLRDKLPDINPKTLRHIVCALPDTSKSVERQAQRWYQLRSTEGRPRPLRLAIAESGEGRFYPGLAAWLGELESLPMCMALGGHYLGDCGGTPDAIGLGCAGNADRVVSAELKVDETRLAAGLGQAMMYRLFSHAAYLAVPRATRLAELARLEDACRMAGVGLILFDHQRPADPGWELRFKPADAQPPTRHHAEKLALLRALLARREAA